MQKSNICYPSPPPSKLKTPSNYLPLNEPLKGPDLAIYSQTMAWGMGKRNPPELSFDNPDIWTWVPKEGEPGVKLRNEVRVRFQNVGEVVAIGTIVHCYISTSFGIDIPKRHLATRYVPSVSTGETVDIFFPLSTDILEGEQRIGVHIELEHSNDQNHVNNQGSQVADGIYTSTGITSGNQRKIPYSFLVYNNSISRRTIHFEAFPSLVNNLPSLSLDPFRDAEYQVEIEVPDTLHGTIDQLDELDMTLLATSDNNELVGGVTIRLLADN